MDLVPFFRGARRVARTLLAPVVAVAIGVHVARGGFAPPRLRALDLALLVAAVVGLALRLSAPARARDPKEAGAPVDTGVALVVLGIMCALVAYAGGAGGPLGALPVVVLAVAVAVVHPRAGAVVVGYAVLCEAALHVAHHGLAEPRTLALRAGLLVAAGAIHHGLTRAEIARVRVHARRMIQDERRRQKEAAQSFRLVSATASLAPKQVERDDDRRVRSSLDEIHASLVGLLVLVRRTMDLRTCALFWADPRQRALRLVEAATDDAELAEAPIPFGAGAVGGCVNLGRPVVLAHLRPEYSGLTYYRGPHGVRAFAAMPILEGGVVRGVLVADRLEDRAFDEDEQAALEVAALQARRMIDNERVFTRLARARDDQARLFEAARALGEALTEDEVIAAVASSARAIVDHDVLVLAGYDPKTREHRVRHVDGEGAPTNLAGATFLDNAGIASAVAKARHALPYKGQFDPKTQFVFTRELALPGCASVLTLPLVVRDRVMGTLTLASRRRNAFPESTRQLLGVLAAHASVALSNAAAVRRLEELATTDPMTSLLNKRALEAEFDKRLRAATRFGRPLAVVMTDIDHFKRVNDTYGHAVGDVVIKGFGAVLARCRRETDVVGRFGGEEFVILCEETETAGAFQLAERVREEFERQVFQTELGPLKVTCSLGIAECPAHGTEREALFARADEALYEAKRGGRNQTRAAPPSDAAKRKDRAASKGAAPRA